jgi:hypothetical protein
VDLDHHKLQLVNNHKSLRVQKQVIFTSYELLNHIEDLDLVFTELSCTRLSFVHAASAQLY